MRQHYTNNTLYFDNKLTINCNDCGATLNVENVKDVGEETFITNEGELYGIFVNEITEEIMPEYIMSNAKELIGRFLIKEDGTTWEFFGDDEIYGEINYFSHWEKIFESELEEDLGFLNWLDGKGIYKGTKITLKDKLGNLWINYNYQSGEKWDKVDESYTSYKKGSFLLVNDDMNALDMGEKRYYSGVHRFEMQDFPLLLSDISASDSLWDLDILIRKDGSVWTYSNQKGLNKITKATPSQDNKPIVEEKYILNPNIKEKQVGENIVVSGIDTNETVETLINQQNFNQKYTIKVFDFNNQEIIDISVKMATGFKIRLYLNGEMIKEYLVVIYGDTTGEGKINAVDALTLIKGINKKIPFKSEAHKEAGRILSESGKEPTAVDALAIVKATNNKYTINQSK